MMVAIDADDATGLHTAAPTPGHRDAPKRRWGLVVRIVGSIVLLALLVWRMPDFDPSELLPERSPATFAWLAGSAGALLVAFMLQTLRWSFVLRALDHRLRFRRLFAQFLAGQFVSNVLPTAFAGDLVRISRTGRDIDDRPHAFASIALERLTGWMVLPFISLTTLALWPEGRSLGGPTLTALLVDIGTLGALVAILVVAANRRWSTAARTATGWRRWIGAVHLGIDALRVRPHLAGATVAAGLAFQLTQCVSVWFAARALEVHPATLVAVLAFFPPTAIGQNLPVGFGGLGVREGGFVLFFGALGASDERAIALGLATYLVTVITSSLGAPSFALGGGRRALEEEAAEEELPESEHSEPVDTASGSATP